MGNGMNKVLPGLFVGNFYNAKDVEQLNANNITHILAIHDTAKVLHKDREYLCIVASDNSEQDLSQFFPRCSDFIHQARLNGGVVLVHCLAGISRSVTVTAAYIMTVTDLAWKDALNAVRGARNVARPNFGFQLQLQRKKPMMLVIHKSWCGACKALKPKFAAADEIATLSKDFVMVNTEDDEEPEDPQFTPDGGYIPRILFLDSNGKVNKDFKNDNGNASYKYYYPSVEDIVEIMKKVKKAVDAGEFTKRDEL